VPATVTPRAAAGEGRVLRGQLTVRTSADDAVGGGLVVIEAITG